MKSKATMGKVLEAYLSGGTVQEGLARAFEAAGVELAPEEPLPDFWDERLHTGKREDGGSLFLYKPNGLGVLIDPDTAGLEAAARNRAALALSHGLRVAATELVRECTHKDGDTRGGHNFIRELRKILLCNELPEAP